MPSPRHIRRRHRALQQRIDTAQAAAAGLAYATVEIRRLRRLAWWGRVAWAVVAIQALLLFPAVVAFCSLVVTCGGVLEAVQSVHWFVIETLRGIAT